MFVDIRCSNLLLLDRKIMNTYYKKKSFLTTVMIFFCFFHQRKVNFCLTLSVIKFELLWSTAVPYLHKEDAS